MVDDIDWNSFVGKRIGPDGRFAVRRLLGRGAVGVVYEALDRKKSIVVAVKLLDPTLETNAEILKRFEREARIVYRTTHPAIVRTLDHGRLEIQVGGKARRTPYLVNEFVRGRTLSQVLKDGLPSVAFCLDVCLQAANGLAALHEASVVHRDLKPANLMVEDETRRLRILDFGIAKDLEASTIVTVHGGYVGTPGYSAPEQYGGKEIDGRADIFSLGVILYELLTGDFLFEGRSTLDMKRAAENFDPRKVAAVKHDLAQPLMSVFVKMTEPRRSRRFKDCAELARDLEGVRRVLAGAEREPPKGAMAELFRRIFGPRDKGSGAYGVSGTTEIL